jgi:cobyrinic acid a,c-diamide synthase
MNRGLVIAAPHSGAGKTTVSLGLMRTFARPVWSCSPQMDRIISILRSTWPPAGFNLDTWAMAPAP